MSAINSIDKEGHGIIIARLFSHRDFDKKNYIQQESTGEEHER